MDDRDIERRREEKGWKEAVGNRGRLKQNPSSLPTQNLFEDFCGKQSPVIYHGVLRVGPMTWYLSGSHRNLPSLGQHGNPSVWKLIAWEVFLRSLWNFWFKSVIENLCNCFSLFPKLRIIAWLGPYLTTFLLKSLRISYRFVSPSESRSCQCAVFHIHSENTSKISANSFFKIPIH